MSVKGVTGGDRNPLPCEADYGRGDGQLRRLTMLKTAMTRMSAVVVMVSVMRGHGLLAMIPDERSNQVHEADVLLLQCWGQQACVHVSACAQVCTCSCVHVSVCARVNAYKCVNIHTCARVSTDTCSHVHTCVTSAHIAHTSII